MPTTVTQGLAEYKAVRFEYACNAATVTYAAGERWCGDPDNPAAPPVDAEVTWAREFRYDGARQRYMNRPLTPWSFQNNNVADTGDTVETRYDGSGAFLDFEMGSAVRAFEPGIGRIEPYDPSNWQNAMTDYYHTDHLGTIRAITGPNGMPLDLNGTSSGHDMVFTAFGEIMIGVSDGGSDRYGYVGAFGYQAHDEMPFLHVGARYYDPSLGRFLQRDPIGISDGFSVYTYADNNPLYYIDPNGLSKHTAQALMQAMARGKVKDVEMILDCAGEMLAPTARAAAQKWLQKMRTPAFKWIEKNKRGDIWRRFPSDLKDRTLGQINELAQKGCKKAKTAWKLLNDKRFDKVAG